MSKSYTPHRVDIITMGCSKNLVDSERLLRRLRAKGYDAVHDSNDVCGELAIVNTCGFIGDAKEESINMILQLAGLKKEGRIKELYVMGCLSERYLSELKQEMPEVDRFYGKFDWTAIIDSLPDLNVKDKAVREWERDLTTPPHSAYLKVSEGCDRFCAYCAIPLITGRHTSRPIDELEAEVRDLVAKGVKEFNVIAQDLSSYGKDLYGEHKLGELIDRLSDIDGVEWIRLHYAYPADFPYDVLDVMARKPNVCKYLDIALQHIADPVLKSMRRHVTKQQTIDLINEIRRRVPDIKLRTTMMVGFPGETEADFLELLDFVKETRFERLGAFAYSEEDDTYAAKHLNDNVPADVKQSRLDRLMAAQEVIAADESESMVGRSVRVLIDREEDDRYVGRTQWDSPEVDPEVFIMKDSDAKLNPGEFITVKVTESYPFELIAKVE